MSDTQKLFNEETLETQQFKCSSCGGTCVFSPKHQKLQCEYCKSLFDLPNNLKVTEQQLEELLNSGNNWTEAQVIQCERCGGKQVVNKKEISKLCCFCGATTLVQTKEIVGIAPQGIVPFKVDKSDTVVRVKRWAESKFFAPNDFKKNIQPTDISGTYYPVFTFDAQTSTTYSGRLYKVETHTRHRNGKTETYTTTKYFNISGTHNQNFDDVVVSASNDISQMYLTILQPFPTNTAIKYDPNYLNGFCALTYSKSGKECWKQGSDSMHSSIKSSILRKYNYTGVSSFNQDTKLANISYKYVLIPVYIGHYTYNKQLYNFYINGHNGKVCGSSPKSGWKIAALVIAILLALALPFIIYAIITGIAIKTF